MYALCLLQVQEPTVGQEEEVGNRMKGTGGSKYVAMAQALEYMLNVIASLSSSIRVSGRVLPPLSIS